MESHVKLKHFLVLDFGFWFICTFQHHSSPSKEHMPLSNTWADNSCKLSTLLWRNCRLITFSWQRAYYVCPVIKFLYFFFRFSWESFFPSKLIFEVTSKIKTTAACFLGETESCDLNFFISYWIFAESCKDLMVF